MTESRDAKRARLLETRAQNMLTLATREPAATVRTERDAMPADALFLVASRELAWIAAQPRRLELAGIDRENNASLQGPGIVGAFMRPKVTLSYKARYYLRQPAASDLEVWLVYCGVTAEVLQTPDSRAFLPP